MLVEELLRSSNFNKLLSAVRECHLMMQRSKEVSVVDHGQSLQVRGWAGGFPEPCCFPQGGVVLVVEVVDHGQSLQVREWHC